MTAEVTRAKYDILSAEFHANPNPTLDRMRAEDPVHWHPSLRCWVLTRYDDVQFVIRDARFSVEKGGAIAKADSRPPEDKLGQCNDYFSTWMVFADPPQHTKLRSVVAKVLGPQALGGLESLVQGITDQLLEAVEPRGRMEVSRDLALPLPAYVVAQLLGLPRSRVPDLKRWSGDMFALFGSGGIVSDELAARVHSSVLECRRYFQDVIAERRAAPGGRDLLAELIESDLDSEQILGTAQMLMVGSNETTTYLTTNAMLALLQHPAEMKRLRDDPSLLESAVEELIRFTGPALSIARRALVDVEMGGRLVRAGDIVCCMLHAANFDPARFTEPHRLDVARQNNRHLGLGYGMHFCVGAALTRSQTKIALGSLLRRFDDFRIEEHEPAWIPNLAIRGLDSLSVRFRLRRSPTQRGAGTIGEPRSAGQGGGAGAQFRD